MGSLQGQLKNGLAEVIFHWFILVKLLKIPKKAFCKSYDSEKKSYWSEILQKHTYGQSTGTDKNGLPKAIFHWVIWVKLLKKALRKS